MDLKGPYWAARLLDPRFDPRSVTRNPGSEIRSLEVRRGFYSRLQTYFEEGGVRLSAAERDNLAAADVAAAGLMDRCQ